MSEIMKKTILQPLTLNDECSSTSKEVKDVKFKCLICEFVENNEKKILQHLYFIHRIVISDSDEIADLKEYLDYWKVHFKGKTNKISKSS